MMPGTVFWVGLDIGNYETDVCVTDEIGRVLHEQRCQTEASEIAGMLEQFPRDQIATVAAEAGTGTHLARKLRALGYPVTIFEARKAHKFLTIRRNKTDTGDAAGLAQLARIGHGTVSEVRLKCVESQHIRSQLGTRQQLIKLRLALEGRIRSLLRLYGNREPLPKKPGALRALGELHLINVMSDVGVDLSREFGPLMHLCEQIRAHLFELDAVLALEASKGEVSRRLMEIPGVGPICALSFISAIEDPMRFPRSNQVANYLGLTPRIYQSGEKYQTRGISKMGSKMTRTHLVLAATVLIGVCKQDCAVRTWGRSLAERIGKRRAAIAVARKLGVLMLAMWKSGQGFDPNRV